MKSQSILCWIKNDLPPKEKEVKLKYHEWAGRPQDPIPFCGTHGGKKRIAEHTRDITCKKCIKHLKRKGRWEKEWDK